MADRSVLTLKLQRLDDLFDAPHLTPFEAGYHRLSGMDRLVAAMEGQPLHEARRIILQLPAASEAAEAGAVQLAIARYCDVMIDMTRTALEAKSRAVRRNLAIGVLTLGLSLGAGAGLASGEFLSPALRNLLANTVSILGTVALWTPVDNLLFGLRPLARTIRLYEAIKSLAVEVERI